MRMRTALGGVALATAIVAAGCSSGHSSAATTTSSTSTSSSTSSTSSTTSTTAAPAALTTVDWTNASVPASVCGGLGFVTLHQGSAVVSSTRFTGAWRGPTPTSVPSPVMIEFGNPTRYGDVDGDGRDEAIVPITCSNGGGTADGDLAHDLVVFTGTAAKPTVLGVITPIHPDLADVPPALLDNASTKISVKTVVVTEVFFGANDPTSSPSGRARTTWTYNGSDLVAGTPVITATPSS